MISVALGEFKIANHFLIVFHFEKDLSANATVIGAAEYFPGCDNIGIHFRSIIDLNYKFEYIRADDSCSTCFLKRFNSFQ